VLLLLLLMTPVGAWGVTMGFQWLQKLLLQFVRCFRSDSLLMY